ncbi:MAG: hypothetical protein Unbinned96contig1001_7 [Prokaryotic dsDNA virus sp.]|nr:MAG: hypothetical protein Unbinned96contig1001_7 [Prokaryotic dsDNA virus sp.]
MKTRFREQKRFLRDSVLVLQVSYEIDATWDDNVPPSLQGIHELWRDARVQDLALVKEQGE